MTLKRHLPRRYRGVYKRPLWGSFSHHVLRGRVYVNLHQVVRFPLEFEMGCV